MKKGFTLIELLAVIIILAIIALITTPVVLNVIDSAKESANKSSITGYADATKLAVNEESFLNHGVANTSWAIENVKYSGSEINCDGVYNSNTYGVLLHSCTVNSSSNKYCYVSGKVYDCDDVEYNSIYENSYAGGKVPVVELTPTEEANANGWINKDFFVRISSNGENYKYCVSDSECVPNTTVNSQSGVG